MNEAGGPRSVRSSILTSFDESTGEVPSVFLFFRIPTGAGRSVGPPVGALSFDVTGLPPLPLLPVSED